MDFNSIMRPFCNKIGFIVGDFGCDIRFRTKFEDIFFCLDTKMNAVIILKHLFNRAVAEYFNHPDYKYPPDSFSIMINSVRLRRYKLENITINNFPFELSIDEMRTLITSMKQGHEIFQLTEALYITIEFHNRML